MKRRAFLGSLLAGIAMPWGRSIALPLTAGSLLSSIDDTVRALYSDEVPLANSPEPLLFSILPRLSSFRLADGTEVL